MNYDQSGFPDRSKEVAEVKLEREREKALAQQEYGYLLTLRATQQFKWYWSKKIGGRIEQLEADVHDLSKTPDERTNALRMLKEFEALREAPEEDANAYRRTMDAKD